ncbi:SatD family protein [Rhodococcus sp. ARC_M12]|uniref:SatD family protein n=1 Tax=Rhodococcus sp. ARC_M12 TaxID=2928854 RepID=UPI001FB4340E|nr:SatD family protein [Rhodococcus sp. ARC_M12]MCJ0976152.1 SatD family protein [Rhodococcus sp. ARC_M12]
MFVLTVDQRRSRRDIDRVPDLLEHYRAHQLVRPFDRTAGDEVQAVCEDAATVVSIALELVATPHWSVGIGIGSVELPLPETTRAGRGPAFEAARDAVTRAKNAPAALAVSGPESAAAEDAETASTLVALLVNRRSDQGREAVALMERGLTQTEAAEQLKISKQAMSQRLSVAGWHIESAGRTLATRLLETADGTGSHRS